MMNIRSLPGRLALAAGAAAILGIAGASGVRAQDEPPLPAGARAPAFQTVTLDGRPISLKQFRGKVVLLDMWATWCGPCRMATPTLVSLDRKYRSRGLCVIGLSVDDDSSKAAVPDFVRQFHIKYTVSVSPEQNAAIKQRYHSDGIPTQFLIDKRGIVRWSQNGYSENEPALLSRMISKLLAEKA